MKKRIERIDWHLLIEIMVSILLFLIFVSRSTLVSAKIIVLVVLLALNVFKYRWDILKQYDKKIVLWCAIYVFLKFLFMVKGEIAGGEAFAYYWKVYLLEPVLYTVVLFPSLNSIKEKKIDNVLLYSYACIIALLTIVFVLFKLGLPFDFLLKLPVTLDVNMDGNYIYISSMAIVSLFFLIPYYMNEIVFSKEKKRRTILCVLLILSLFIMIIVGRRALLLVVAMAVPIVTFLKYKKDGIQISKEMLKKIVIVLGLVALAIIIFLVFLGAELRLGSAGKELVNVSNNIRLQQIEALLRAWTKHPIIGTGYGINVEDCVRSDIPGMYEFSYIALLVQTGVIGTLLHGILILSLLWNMYKIAMREKSTHVMSVFVGVVCFLIGNFTNPYLYSFDGMWTLFYALALLNKRNVRTKAEA